MEEAQKQAALNQLTPLLEKNFRWHDNDLPPEGIGYVGTNIGVFGFVGLREQLPVLDADQGMRVTQSLPTTKLLVCVSSVPTSMQKIALLNWFAHQFAKRLGAPAGYLAVVSDPTRPGFYGKTEEERKITEDGQRNEHQMSESSRLLLNRDEYKTIRDPYTITIKWAVEVDGKAKAVQPSAVP